MKDLSVYRLPHYLTDSQISIACPALAGTAGGCYNQATAAAPGPGVRQRWDTSGANGCGAAIRRVREVSTRNLPAIACSNIAAGRATTSMLLHTLLHPAILVCICSDQEPYSSALAGY